MYVLLGGGSKYYRYDLSEGVGWIISQIREELDMDVVRRLSSCM